jgi:hypothetical protein
MQQKERWIIARNAQAMPARSSLSPTTAPELHCAASEKTLFIVQQACKPQLTESTIFVFPPTLNKGKHMNRFIKSIPLAAALALTVASASAQTAAPVAATASAPTTVGVTPKEAAEATRKAVPRSDTATLVRTSPSPANKASDALNASTTGSPTGVATNNTNAAPTGPAQTAGNGSKPRPPRADRN